MGFNYYRSKSGSYLKSKNKLTDSALTQISQAEYEKGKGIKKSKSRLADILRKGLEKSGVRFRSKKAKKSKSKSSLAQTLRQGLQSSGVRFSGNSKSSSKNKPPLFTGFNTPQNQAPQFTGFSGDIPAVSAAQHQNLLNQGYTQSWGSAPGFYEKDGQTYHLEADGSLTPDATGVAPMIGGAGGFSRAFQLGEEGASAANKIYYTVARAKLYSNDISTASRIGKATKYVVSGNKVYKVGANVKELELVNTIFRHKLSIAALMAGGTWLGSVFMGLWGKGESAEPISMATYKYLIDYGKKTGDWSLYNEAINAAEELTDIPMWKKVLLASPLSAVEGSISKIKGAKKGVELMKKIGEDYKIQQQNKETDEEKWARIKQREMEQEKEMIDYYNEQRKLQLQWEEEAADRDMREDAAFWRKEQAKIEKLKTEQLKKQAEFWFEYRKRLMELEREQMKDQAEFWLEYRKQVVNKTAPSHLGFGLL